MFAAYILATLLTSDLRIGEKTVHVEIADTPNTTAKGLMGRTSLPEGQGMLFVFESAEILTFWMKNTLVPLSVGFFDDEKKLINIADMNPPNSQSSLLPTFQSSSPARYALEVPQGWFVRNNIKPGMKFTLMNSEE